MARRTGSHSETTEPRVRAAALRLFARHGFAAVSMRQIAADVGVQAGALYNYTPDKQSLLFDLMHGHLQEVLQDWAATPKGHSPQAALDAFSRFHIRFHLDRPDAVFVSYMELRNLTPENFVVIERLRSAYEKELSKILKAGAEEGAFVLSDLRLTTMAVIAMLTGVTSWYREDGRLSRLEIEAIYAAMVRRAVGGQA